MDIPPFLLDHWLSKHSFATPPIAYDLAASTVRNGPSANCWPCRRGQPGRVILSYSPAEGSRALRDAIGAFLGVDPDWVVVTLGASEAFSILLCPAARPGANIVLPHPALSRLSRPMAGVWGIDVRHVRLSPARHGFRQRAGDVLAAVDDDTVLALVNTPHNPVGTIMPRDEIAGLASALEKSGVPLIVDEVYHPLYFGRPQVSAAAIGNVNVMGDMSKALSLAGLRLGWLVERDPETAREDDRCAKLFHHQQLAAAGAACGARLRQPRGVAYKAPRGGERKPGRAVGSFMERVSDVLAWAKPAGGTVCFPWFRDGRDSRPFCEALAANGVLVAPGDCFGMPEHMRMGFALLKREKFLEGMAIFERVLREQ